MTTSVPYLAPYGPPPVPVEERTRLYHLQAVVSEILNLCADAETRTRGSTFFPALISVEAVHTILKQHGLQ